MIRGKRLLGEEKRNKHISEIRILEKMYEVYVACPADSWEAWACVGDSVGSSESPGRSIRTQGVIVRMVRYQEPGVVKSRASVVTWLRKKGVEGRRQADVEKTLPRLYMRFQTLHIRHRSIAPMPKVGHAHTGRLRRTRNYACPKRFKAMHMLSSLRPRNPKRPSIPRIYSAFCSSAFVRKSRMYGSFFS